MIEPLSRDLRAICWETADNRMNAAFALAITLLLASPVRGDWRTHYCTFIETQAATSPARSSAWSPPASVSGAAESRPAPVEASDSAPPVPKPSADLTSPMTPGPDYVIGLGDELRISVWKEPEFSSTVQVRSDGKISLPLVNDVIAVGFKPMDLAAKLTERLKQYVDDPRVTIIVTKSRPPVIYMEGEVGHRGPMAFAPNMTVFEAVMTAGLSMFANSKKIYVLRVENGIERKIAVNYKRLIKGQGLNQNILLKPGDVIVVP